MLKDFRSALCSLAFLVSCSFLFASPLMADTVVVNAGAGATIRASAIDQPQVSAMITDGAGNLIKDPSGNYFLLTPYIDTGSSGFVISSDTARGFTMNGLFGPETYPGLGIDGTHGEFVGHYTDYGFGGPETGDVTTLYGVRIRSGAPLEATIDPDTLDIIPPVVVESEFSNRYGYHSLWVRRQEGFGERTSMTLFGETIDLDVTPMDIFGMPVIKNSVLVMDPTSIQATPDGLGVTRMNTQLLPKGSVVPATNMTFHLQMRDFIGSTPAPGEVFPSHANNPVFTGVTIVGHDSLGQPHQAAPSIWVFDTGSTSTMISFAKAQEIGIIDSSYATFADFLAAWQAGGGLTLPITGIGSIDHAEYAPILTLDAIHITDSLGRDVVWNNVDVLVEDFPGIDGVFGLNLLMPAVTLDLSDPLFPGEVGESPGYFDKIVFSPLDDSNADLSVMFNPSPEPTMLTMLALGIVGMFARRRGA